EKETTTIEHHREVFGRHDREEHSTEGCKRDEHDRRYPPLRRERVALVLERDASTQQCRDAREAPPYLAAAPRDRTENDREAREDRAAPPPRGPPRRVAHREGP